MKLRGVIFEDFVNYKKPAMVLEFPWCDFKCDAGRDEPVCQNNSLLYTPIVDVSVEGLVDQYLKNSITEAVVCQGLEPMNSFDSLVDFISCLRKETEDDIVIYTGFNREEIEEELKIISRFPNIIMKFGRFIPGEKPHKDPVLGVDLASDNQYAEKIT